MTTMNGREINKKPRIRCSEPANLPTSTGAWTTIAFYDPHAKDDGETHVVLYKGDVAGGEDVLVRVQSECLTSEVFGSLKCDCDDQLKLAMRRIRKAGRGIIVYLRQEGRGVGIFAKIRAYHLQDHGLDTIEANKRLGLPVDSRFYGSAADILAVLGVRSIRLLSNNPLKAKGLAKLGVKVAGTVPLRAKPNRYNRGYLKIKRRQMGHTL